MTRGPGREKLVGRAPGKLANIVGMPGNSITEISVTAKVDFVMKDGIVFREPTH
jgi:tryptophan 2-monooxygenase